MNDAPLMRVVERAASLQGVCKLQSVGEVCTMGDNLFQAFAFDQLHLDVVEIFFVTHVIDGDDVGMLQSTRRLRFPVEPLQ